MQDFRKPTKHCSHAIVRKDFESAMGSLCAAPTAILAAVVLPKVFLKTGV